jgi:hypothetical protein
LIFRLDPIIDKKSLHDRRRISQAGGFDHQGIEFFAVLEKLEKTAHKIAAHGAADAAIAHFDDFLIRRDQQMVVNADFAEFIDNNSDPASVVRG